MNLNMSEEKVEKRKSQQSSKRPSVKDNESVHCQSMESPFIHVLRNDKQHQIDSHQQLSSFHLPQIKRQSSEKLQDFVEKEGDQSNLHIQSFSRVSQMNLRRLSNVNMSRLSEFHTQLITNMNQKNRSRLSILATSALNYNFEDMIDKVQEIEDGKLVVKMGDQVHRYTIGPNIMAYLDAETRHQITEYQKPLYQRIHPFISWFLVFYATINGACIPPWIMQIPDEKYLRTSWRFYMQTLMMIPFLIYEKRNLPADKQYQYSLSYIFSLTNLKKVYMVAFSNSIWFTMVLFAFEWNFISHALVLSSLSQFFFSVHRAITKQEENHNFESGGQAMIGFGVFCVLADTLTYDQKEAPPATVNYLDSLVYYRNTWQRLIIGNFTAILVSFLMFKMGRHQAEARQIFPQFLSMTLVFAFTAVNMTMSNYFFAGTGYVDDTFWNYLSIFCSEQFSGFFFMSLMLGMGNFITNFLINKLFEPIVPATVSLFEPVFSTILLYLIGVQIMPRGLACLGYCFIIPGLFVIVLGQHLVMQKSKQDEQQRIHLQLQEELNRLEAIQLKDMLEQVCHDEKDDGHHTKSAFSESQILHDKEKN